MTYSRKNPYSVSERNQRSYSRQFGQANSPYQQDYDNYTQRQRFYNDNDDDHYENDYDVYASNRFQDEDDDYGFEGNYRNQYNRYSPQREFASYGRSYQNRFNELPNYYGREGGYYNHPYSNYGRETGYNPSHGPYNNGYNTGRGGYFGNAFNERSQYGHGSANYGGINYGRSYSGFDSEYNSQPQNVGSEYSSRRRRRQQYAY